jgi:hypothetical protein
MKIFAAKMLRWFYSVGELWSLLRGITFWVVWYEKNDLVFNNERWSGHKFQEFVWELLIEHGRTTWEKCRKLIKWFFVLRGKLFKGLIRVGEKIKFFVLGLAILLSGFMTGCVGATLIDFLSVLLCSHVVEVLFFHFLRNKFLHLCQMKIGSSFDLI